MGVPLPRTGLFSEFVLSSVKGITKGFIICVTVLILFFLMWAELAVGIFESPFAGS
jgi:hypothetical protein